MRSLLNQDNIETSKTLPGSFDRVRYKEDEQRRHITAWHILTFVGIREILMFSLALSPIITPSSCSGVLKCKSSSPAAWQVMFLALISISEVKGRHDIFHPAAVTVTYTLPVHFYEAHPACRANWLWINLCETFMGGATLLLPCARPIRAPSWPLLSESGKPLALSYQYSSVDLQLRRGRLLFPHMLICIRQHVWEMACWLPLLLVPKPTVASLPLSVSTFVFQEGKVSWFLACQRRVLWGLHWLSPYHSRKFTACLKKW